MFRLRYFLSLLWLLIGLALTVFAIYDATLSSNASSYSQGSITSFFFMLLFAFLAGSGGVLGMRSRYGGSLCLGTAATLVILYFIAILLFGALERAGTLLSIAIVVFALIAVATAVVLRLTRRVSPLAVAVIDPPNATAE